MARSLWNNMLEPVGGKRATWSMNKTPTCPTSKYPYLFTSRNSDKALAELKRSSSARPLLNVTTSTFRSNVTSIWNITANSTAAIDSDSFINDDLTTTMMMENSFNTTTDRPRKKSSSWSRIKLLALLSVLFFLLLLLFLNFRKRRHLRLHLPQMDNPNFDRLDEESDNSDMEVYAQPSRDGKFHDDKQMTETHGTRMSFE